MNDIMKGNAPELQIKLKMPKNIQKVYKLNETN